MATKWCRAQACHFCGGIAALRNCKGRREQQTLIEQNRVRVLLAGLQALITHGDNGELFKLIAEGQQNERGDEVECGMHDRDHKRGDRLVGECEMENAVCNIKAGKTDDGAEHVKVDMHGGHALCAFCGADGGKQRRDTCTDVLAHNDRQRHAERNAAVMARDCRMPSEAAELWISAVMPAPTKMAMMGLSRIVKTSLNCGKSASGFTAPLIMVMPVIKMAKPDTYGADVLFLAALGEHDENDADERHDGRKALRL